METKNTDFSGLATSAQMVASAYAEIQTPREATQDGTLRPNEPGIRKLGTYRPPKVEWFTQ